MDKMGSGGRWFWLGLCLILGICCAAYAQPRIEISAKPLFSGFSREESTIPLQVIIENQGASVQGRLVVSLEGFRTSRRYVYPLELPSGSRKQVIAYPFADQYVSRLQVTYESGYRALKQTTIPLSTLFEDKRMMVAVSDEIGGLGFLSQTKLPLPIERFPTRNRGLASASKELTYQPAFTRAEEFPTRASALNCLNAIILGAGAERLNESQFQAIRTWVMMGGTLIVPGGAGALYLQMPALQAILPVQAIRTEQVNSLTGLRAYTNQPEPQGAAILSASQAKPSAIVVARQGNAPLIAIQPYGLGSVAFLAFSPWDQPMRGYAHNSFLWKKLLSELPSTDPSQIQSMILLSQSNDNWWQEDESWRWGGGAPQRFSSKREFRVPGVGIVMAVLFAYFILVVPVNFFALKKLRALDWAWVTVPAIALIFVFALYRVGAGIYKQGQISDTQATLIMMAGERAAYAFASTLFFFPRAGAYELRFDRAEMVESGTQDSSHSELQEASLESFEGDPILIPEFRVRNLSYQWMRYTRSVELPQTIEADLRIHPNPDRIKGKVINRLPFTLDNVRLYVRGMVFKLERIEGGKTVQIDLPFTSGEMALESVNRASEGPLVTAAFADTERNNFPFGILQANADGPNVSPQLDVSGDVNQTAQIHCFIRLKRP